MGDRPQIELFGALQSLYQTRDYTDYTLITCDGARHAVHRALLCPRSPFFAHATQTTNPREITFTDEEPAVVALMIEYLYLLNYLPQSQQVGSGTPSSAALSHRHSSSASSDARTDAGTYGNLYGSAAINAFGGPSKPLHQRGSLDLQAQHPYDGFFGDRSASSLTVHAGPGQDISSFGGPAARRGTSPGAKMRRAPSVSPLASREPFLTVHALVYGLAEKVGIGGLKALALDKFKIQLTRHWDSPELAEAIHVVYNSTPSSDKDMREAVAEALGWHGRLLDKPEIEVAIMEINGLAYQLLKRTRRAEPEFD